MGASWRRLGASCAVLGPSWGVLGRLGAFRAVLEASWAPKPPQHKPDSTWNGKRRSFKGSFMQKPYGTILDRKASSRSRTLRSLRSLRSPCGFSLGFRWVFARFSLAILDRKPPKRSANLPQNPWIIELNTPQNPPQNPPESTPEAEKIEVWRGLRFRLLFVTFCAPPGGVLGPSWGVLGASWGRLGAALGRLGGVLGRLGTVLGCLGAVLGVLGPSWGLAAVLKPIFDQI